MHPITENFIVEQLRAAYRPGQIGGSDGNQPAGELDGLKCAAVLLPLVCFDGQWQILFTRRTEIVESHKGQVSFPGGACDPGETTPEQTALREAEEEIGVQPSDVRVLGRMNDYVTITKYRVTPVVGVVPWPYVFRVSSIEVGRVFTMPLEWLAERKNRWEFSMPGNERLRLVAYHPYDGELLWGATARMVLNFLHLLGF